MTSISLRDYTQEINQMIENGQAEGAIDHSLHVLKYFPRHVDTYRLLGTAYLEDHRYSEASDVFLRVISVIPDDLVAHIGMSVIREHENRLDDAIWHMQRVFEFQPANRLLRDELRRLYGAREGLEPPRVYLTRGALARMYYKGDLLPQAIAELQAALSEEPNRLDLLILLARSCSQAGQYKQAAQTCLSLLNKLPNCLDANRILLESSWKGAYEQDITANIQRVQEIDPYFVFVTPQFPASDQVSDIAVNLEWLDRSPAPPRSEFTDDTGQSVDIPSVQQADLEMAGTLPGWISDLEEVNSEEWTPDSKPDEVPTKSDTVQEGTDAAPQEIHFPEETPPSDEDTKPTQVAPLNETMPGSPGIDNENQPSLDSSE